MSTKKNILIAPLDWGLGHAARCVPIINELLQQHCNVIIGADKGPLAFLQAEFSDLTTIKIPGYDIRYPKGGGMILKMMLASPKIIKGIKKEHQLLDQIIDDYKIDLVISDNRYGLWSKKVPCVFISHQLFIKAPLGEKLIKKINQQYISNYDECWIPDNETAPFLSGDLAHKISLESNYKFIGPLSRFEKREANNKQHEFDLMVIISGPEPQRTIFEELIFKQLKSTNYKALIVRGLPENKEEIKNKNANIKIVNHLKRNDFLAYLQKSKLVISRSGYSTIMDLATLGKQAVFVPTPGQTEQEYLAEYHFKKGHYLFMNQKDFELDKAVNKSNNFTGIQLKKGVNKLLEAITSVLLD